MTEADKQRELGQALQGYKTASEELGALLSKLSRIASAIEPIKKTGASADPENLLNATQTALNAIGDADLLAVLADIQRTCKAKSSHKISLAQQGYDRYIAK